MHIEKFKEVVATFADPGTEMLVDGARVLFSINGNLIDAAVTTKYGDVYIDEGAGPMPASLWIVKRLANLTMLASRLKERIQTNKNFVSPAARVLQSLENNPNEVADISCDALAATVDVLNQRSPLETTVLYLTSDAGEGKTSLINELAYQQATSFLENKADWLLIPIPLAGRHFLRFDDITVGALQNRYRFPFLYYNSFLALVQMGVIVPAFDGFEEMFVENSSGEALSAMGILVGALESTGAVLIAARKAYFEFENLKAQEKLYDTISSYAVGFGKLELSRWERKQFFEYCALRKIASFETIYESVCDRLGSNHALLTRPVLVKRLVDIAEASKSLESFIDQIQISGADFFSVFVRGIIEREANEKWIDRSGEVGTPLLTVDEHVELLSRVALAMWDARLDYLKRDMLEFESDLYCEIKRKSPFQAQQIRERLRGHALLIASSNALDAVEFDHDEFKLFFVGEALAEVLKTKGDRAKTEALSALRRGVLPEQSLIALLRALKRDASFDRVAAAKRLIEIGLLDGQASYTQENCGILVLRLLSDVDAQGLSVENLAFGVDAFRDRKLQGIKFCNCHFSQSSLENTSFEKCIFDGCTFGQLRVFSSTNFIDVLFTDSQVDSIRLDDSGLEIWEPNGILAKLHSLGVTFGSDQDLLVDNEAELNLDDELANLEKLLRYFMRSTHVSESVIKIKLGDRGQGFLDNTVPSLLECKILEQIENRGGGNQRRFRLSMPLARVNASIAASEGEFSKFLEIATET
jgi:Pentapeptide repeats (9 copies)